MHDKGREGVGITVDGELVCPVALHPKCVAVGTCQSPFLGEGY